MTDYESQEINHLGIIAGICEEIELVKKIDESVGASERELSVGEAVKAMIINAMGFVNHPLYLTPSFFENKPVDILIREGLEAKDINEYSLGRALDLLYEKGVTEVFSKVSNHAMEITGVKNEFNHLDSTSVCFHGEYKQLEQSEAAKITFGYSRDDRPDLKQMVVSLICKYKSSIPSWFEVNDGNKVDKTTFPKTINAYVQQLQVEDGNPYFIADSALYVAKNLELLSSQVKWVTRVPETIKEAKNLIKEVTLEDTEETSLEGYRVKQVSSNYGNVEQRWLVVLSDLGEQREDARLQRHLEKSLDKDEKKLWHLTNKVFDTQEQAFAAIEKLNKQLKYRSCFQVQLSPVHRYEGKGRPKVDAVPTKTLWKIAAQLRLDPLKLDLARESFGKFIIATNELDCQKIPVSDLIAHYKNQAGSVERGFRFLKDPMFFANGLFLKKPERIMALLMIMGLSLLVYSLAERKLRLLLQENNQTVPDQKGKPTLNPTMRWIFQLFHGIHLLIVKDHSGSVLRRTVLNIKPHHRDVLTLLGHEVQKCYFYQN